MHLTCRICEGVLVLIIARALQPVISCNEKGSDENTSSTSVGYTRQKSGAQLPSVSEEELAAQVSQVYIS